MDKESPWAAKGSSILLFRKFLVRANSHKGNLKAITIKQDEYEACPESKWTYGIVDMLTTLPCSQIIPLQNKRDHILQKISIQSPVECEVRAVIRHLLVKGKISIETWEKERMRLKLFKGLLTTRLKSKDIVYHDVIPWHPPLKKLKPRFNPKLSCHPYFGTIRHNLDWMSCSEGNHQFGKILWGKGNSE